MESLQQPPSPPVVPLRFGELLVARGLINEVELALARMLQEGTNERIGQILLTLGLVRRLDLYRILGQHWGLPFVVLPKARIDEDLARRLPMEEAIPRFVMPMRLQGRTLVAAVAEQPTPALTAWLLAHYDEAEDVRYEVATDWDVDWAIRKVYRARLLESSVYGLYVQSRSESAYTVFTAGQFAGLGAAVLVLIAGLYAAPTSTLVVLNAVFNLFFLGSIVFKFVVSMAGAHTEHFEPVTKAEVDALQDSELPRYTVLVPVYREANIVGLLMQNLAALDYPEEKLEVLVLVEEDDPETLAAAKAAHPSENVQFVLIPHGNPKTKPKACNVGLYFARGEYLVIYDAEDRPEPDQLKKVVVAFRKGDPRLVCVQGALNYFNWSDNVLTRMFALEYSYWFDYMLPGLQLLGLPIPLGGTSNHFRTDRLRELGGWDPFNVTEDADLGIRATMRGYTVGVVNSTTFEEANGHFGNWIRQRSRWIKGYMQTALVHSRHPFRLLRRVGLKQALGFALLIGGTPATFLAAPLLYGLCVVWAVVGSEALEPYFPLPVLYVSLFNLLWGNALAVYLNMLAVFRRRSFGLVAFALLNPFYWLMHSRAAYKALRQLFTNPFYWEKTLHGLSPQAPGSGPADP